MKMFYRRRTWRASALFLFAALALAGLLAPAGVGVAASGQEPSQKPRERRAGEAPSSNAPARQQQPAPSTKPTPASSDDASLQDDEVLRVETDLTNVLFTAIDKNKRFITTLKQEDVRVYEDGVPQQVFTFQRETERPLSLAIVIDTSRSQERTLPDEKSAARSFVDAVVRPGKDEVAVLSFTGETTLELGLTGSLQRIRRAIDRVEFVPPSGYLGGGVSVGGTPPISPDNQSRAGSTALWEALWVTSEEVLAKESSDKTRRAIILLTDGYDTSSTKVKVAEAIDRALKADAVIYSIGIGDNYFEGVDQNSLRKVSEQTGGRAFFPRDETDLRNAFAQIQQELRSQYLVAYSPTNKAKNGAYRVLKVEIVNPELQKQNIRLTYRQGYFR